LSNQIILTNRTARACSCCIPHCLRCRPWAFVWIFE